LANKKESEERKMARMREWIEGVLIAQETQKKEVYEVAASRSEPHNEAATSEIEAVEKVLKEALIFEAEAGAFFRSLEKLEENKEVLLKMLADPAARPVFLTHEIKHILTLLAKNEEIAEFEDRLGKAIDALEADNIGQLEVTLAEKGYQLSPEAQQKLDGLREAIVSNPNYILEKLVELKKGPKGGKGKK
jgi:hypothetical protein